MSITISHEQRYLINALREVKEKARTAQRMLNNVETNTDIENRLRDVVSEINKVFEEVGHRENR